MPLIIFSVTVKDFPLLSLYQRNWKIRKLKESTRMEINEKKKKNMLTSSMNLILPQKPARRHENGIISKKTRIGNYVAYMWFKYDE